MGMEFFYDFLYEAFETEAYMYLYVWFKVKGELHISAVQPSIAFMCKVAPAWKKLTGSATIILFFFK